jgi:hypothetical protein
LKKSFMLRPDESGHLPRTRLSEETALLVGAGDVLEGCVREGLSTGGARLIRLTGNSYTLDRIESKASTGSPIWTLLLSASS